MWGWNFFGNAYDRLNCLSEAARQSCPVVQKDWNVGLDGHREPASFSGVEGMCGVIVASCPEVHNMPGNLIYYALVLVVVALVAAFFGFGGVSATAMSGAHLFIWLAIVIVVVGVVLAVVRRV